MTTNILVLCHGNVNRSPLSGYLLQQLLPCAVVRSAGLKPGARGRASLKLREWAQDQSHWHPEWYTTVNRMIDQHRAREVTDDDLGWAEHIIVMDQGNLRRLAHRCNSVIMTLTREPLSFKGRPVIMLGDHHSPPLPRIPDPAFMQRGSEEAHKAYLACEQATIRVAENGPWTQ